ncbi:MAG: glycerol kinase GlpK [Firmicutes bacterium]|nr:glycerol kinase GlpK [Bacillota bacterium]
MREYVLALDQGTTSSRAILFDRWGRVVGQRHQEIPPIYPRPGWVEHDPEAIWESQIRVARRLLAETGIAPDRVAAIGVTNQRETVILWDRETGRPVCPAIVWQCRRTADLCDALKAAGWEETVRARTGLVIDPYFSGTKVRWVLDHVPEARDLVRRGRLLFGTVDTWLIWRLTGGRVHATDYSNASRTMLFNIRDLTWDPEILAGLEIPGTILPEVRPSSYLYGETDPDLFGAPIPIAGCAGDQQAALFGQACFRAGEAKVTYGTGAFVLMNTGERAVPSRAGLLTTVAWGLGGQVTYALEGSVFIAGAAVQWLRDELQIIRTAAETEELARSVPDNGGVYFVPAFVGLGAPIWDPYARGTVVGLTRGTSRAHLARAVLEAIGYQVRDVLEAMQRETGLPLPVLKVDGGAAANGFLAQFQADILGVPVERPATVETTALGAVYLAGLAVGLWQDVEELRRQWRCDRRFEPAMAEEPRSRLYGQWRRAVERARRWAAE